MSNDLDYQISCEEKDGYLLVKVTDTALGLPAAVDYQNKVMRRIREGGHKRVIVVRDIPLRMDRSQLKIFGDVIANMLPNDAMMAIVDNTVSHEETVYFTKVAAGRGKEVEAFRTLSDAEEWINRRSSTEAGPFATRDT